jgi:hypothetical protein
MVPLDRGWLVRTGVASNAAGSAETAIPRIECHALTAIQQASTPNVPNNNYYVF